MQQDLCPRLYANMRAGLTTGLQARTGSGKTNAVLAPAIEVIRQQGGHCKLILVAKTKAQCHQLYKACAVMAPDIRRAIFTSRDRDTCSNDDVRGRPNASDLCEDLLSSRQGCPFHTPASGSIYSSLAGRMPTADVEDTGKAAKECHTCMHKGMRNYVEECERCGKPLICIMVGNIALSVEMLSNRGLVLGKFRIFVYSLSLFALQLRIRLIIAFLLLPRTVQF